MVPGEELPWVAQLRRGTAEHCVLALLHQGERYGFDLARILVGADRLIASEGTIYPLLARLRRNGLVETTWQESTAGPPRRYYRITEAGERSLASFIDHWKVFRDTVDHILGEGSTA
ncbi:MAG: PadR family transcriptional regulator [Actinomycetota bacterium]|nr:PadR family transcriptional regulator [Actinomycetota bacterium]